MLITMRGPLISLALLLLASNLLVFHDQGADASLIRVIRQTSNNGEQESITAKPAASQSGTQQTTSIQQQEPGRLYPDLPQQPQFVPQFNGVGPHHYPAISHHHAGPTPFVPFGLQVPTSRLNADQQPAPFGRLLPQPRPMTPAERLQSQSFANGLGRRLLSMIGIDTESNNNNQTNTEQQQGSASASSSTPVASGQKNAATGPLEALQNSTVLQQLNKGVNSIYGGLSKMYNSTIREQLDLLQERLKAETQNSTNPWSQRMAEQVPQFFQQLASKVGQAQDQLNKVWQEVSQAAQGNSSVLARSQQQRPSSSSSFLGSFDHFFHPAQSQPGDFFSNIGQSLGMTGGANNGPQMMAQQANQPQQQQQPFDLAMQLSDFWNSQVQPQIGMVRNQVSRVWRDLTSSGAFSPETIVRSRSSQSQASANGGNSSNLIDDILKEVDMSGGSEYALIDQPADGEQSDQNNGAPQQAHSQPPAGNDKGVAMLSPQMQNRLIAMQRELNQLWMGLTNSLQGAINNVKQAVNPGAPGPRFGLNAMASSNNNNQQASSDPALNEIDGKVRDLSKLQRDADMVYETVQQQQRETQQRQSMGDRFKNFFNNMNVDLGAVNELPDRIGQSFNRFGVAVGDLWNQIPERWDSFMQNMRPQQQMQQQQELKNKLKASTTSTTTDNPKPELLI